MIIAIGHTQQSSSTRITISTIAHTGNFFFSGAAAWAVFIFALLKKKSWTIPVGIFAGAMSMLAGYPLGINNALFEAHRFSMFLPAPLLSTALVIYLLLPGTRRMIDAWNAKQG